jgi:hypothetical protein
LRIIRSCLSVAMRAGPVFFHLISQNQTHWRHLSNAVVGHAGNPCYYQNLQPKGYRHNFCVRPAYARSNPPPDRPDGSTVCHNDFGQPLGLSAWRSWWWCDWYYHHAVRSGAARCDANAVATGDRLAIRKLTSGRSATAPSHDQAHGQSPCWYSRPSE